MKFALWKEQEEECWHTFYTKQKEYKPSPASASRHSREYVAIYEGQLNLYVDVQCTHIGTMSYGLC